MSQSKLSLVSDLAVKAARGRQNVHCTGKLCALKALHPSSKGFNIQDPHHLTLSAKQKEARVLGMSPQKIG